MNGKEFFVSAPGRVMCATRIVALAGPGSMALAGDAVAFWTDTLEVDRPMAPKPTERVDLREAAMTASTAQALHGPQLLLTPDASLAQVRALFDEHRVRAAPVVDGDGKLVGLVSNSDFAARRWQGDGAAATSLADVRVDQAMAHVVHALPEHAPLAYAFGLLAASGLTEAPVVKDDGVVVGMITANDLLRWVARDLGYVLTG